MWQSEMDDIRHGRENTKSLRDELSMNEFQISDASKAVLRMEVRQWVVNFMPKAKDVRIDHEVGYLMTVLLPSVILKVLLIDDTPSYHIIRKITDHCRIMTDDNCL